MKLHQDSERIKRIGVTKLARRLGYSPQRVQNWLYRGIPLCELLNNKILLSAFRKDMRMYNDLNKSLPPL